MLSLNQRIEVFDLLSRDINRYLSDTNDPKATWLRSAVSQAQQRNGWFVEREVTRALAYWADALKGPSLKAWLEDYQIGDEIKHPQNVGIIMAGNIPMVGMHDLVCVFLSGHKALVKCSSSDDVLLPALVTHMIELNANVNQNVQIILGKLEYYQAMIATGSNNTARHFQAYFGNKPHIIRRNRTGIAILDGSENSSDLEALMADALTYFGLGCRNVTKLFLPANFDLNLIFKASLPFAYLMSHNKYHNNYTYHKALMMLERKNILDNDLILLTESKQLYSPVSVINYEYYNGLEELNSKINDQLMDIQCVIGKNHRPFGSAQSPRLRDYADGVDTLEFLLNLEPARLLN